MEAAGPSQIELAVLDWFKAWIGYPREAAGVLVSGGSAANITALACAREALLGAMSDRAVIYVSDQGHSSIARAARLMGFRSDQVRVLESDRDRRMRLDALAAAVQADTQAGRQPLLVAAAAGSTNTGAVDPLGAIAASVSSAVSGCTSTAHMARLRRSASASGESWPASRWPTR